MTDTPGQPPPPNPESALPPPDDEARTLLNASFALLALAMVVALPDLVVSTIARCVRGRK